MTGVLSPVAGPLLAKGPADGFRNLVMLGSGFFGCLAGLASLAVPALASLLLIRCCCLFSSNALLEPALLHIALAKASAQ